MKRVSSLLLLLALTASQIAATWCPMASQGLGAGAESPEMAVMAGHSHAPDGDHTRDNESGHQTQGHDGHGDEASCLILMSCGTMATSVPPTAVSALSALQYLDDGSGPQGATSVSTSMEPPPPRQV